MTAGDAYAQLLWRAECLRRLARQIDAGLVDRLTAAAGEDTWLGPTADAFVADLARVRSLVMQADAIVSAAADRLAAAAERLRQEELRAGVRS